ncbi:hypothetical protein D3C86_2077730 [compost metagenome]
MIGKDDDGLDTPGMLAHYPGEAGPQQVDLGGKQSALAVGQIEGEEPGGARRVIAAVSGHGLQSFAG